MEMGFATRRRARDNVSFIACRVIRPSSVAGTRRVSVLHSPSIFIRYIMESADAFLPAQRRILYRIALKLLVTQTNTYKYVLNRLVPVPHTYTCTSTPSFKGRRRTMRIRKTFSDQVLGRH